MDPRLGEIISSYDSDATPVLEAIVKLADRGQYPAGIKVVTQFGDIATCRLPRNQIREVWSAEQVFSLKAPRVIGIDPEPEEWEEGEEAITSSSYRRRPNIEHTGKDVVVGLADWGFDFTHPNFLNRDGSTRFLSIWDQSAEYHESAAKYGYGRIFSRGEINDALQTSAPFETLGYHPGKGDPLDNGAHGTHVLDIAAGNGAVGQPGVAPEADLLAVHLSSENISGLASLGDSVRILEAIDFIGEVAGNRPLVCNLSVGNQGGSHQGNSLVEQGMDNFLKEKPNRCIVQSTGNYYRAKAHSSGKLGEGEADTLIWKVGHYDLTPNELEIWYPGEDVFGVSLKNPETGESFSAQLGEIVDLLFEGNLVGRLYHRANEPNTGDHHINIFLYKQCALLEAGS